MRSISLAFFIFSIFSCSNHKNINKEIVLSIEQSTCNGNCPAFKITYYSDGTGVYNGIKYTTLGKQHFNYSISDLKEIIKISEKIKFSEIENKYFNKGLQDLQIKKIFINGNSVVFNERPSDELINIYNKIKSIVKDKKEY